MFWDLPGQCLGNYHIIVLLTLVILIVILSFPFQFVIIFNAVVYQSVSYNSYVYPVWAEGVGWSIACAEIVCIPLFMVYEICKQLSYQEQVNFHTVSTCTYCACEQVSTVQQLHANCYHSKNCYIKIFWYNLQFSLWKWMFYLF